MANPRKPTHLKAVQGTLQKCRTNPNEPVTAGGIPDAPDHLSDREVGKFLQLCVILDGLGIASRDDVDALSMLTSVLVEIEEDTVLLASVGAFYTPSMESGIVRAHPAVGRLATNRQRAQALLNEFGLTPAARSKVSAGVPKEINPFAVLGGSQ